jgi:hypothetical protein
MSTEQKNKKIDGAYSRDGILRIAVTNIKEFEALIEKANAEAKQLSDTIYKLRTFDIEFDINNKSK